MTGVRREDQEIPASTIHPFGPQVTVAGVPKTDSTGEIWVPGNQAIDRGIVVESNIEGIDTGDLIYFHKEHDIRIKDVGVVGIGCIIAKED